MEVTTMSNRCPWCADPNDEEWSDDLCHMHIAEYEGCSEDALDRQEAAEYAEWHDIYGHLTQGSHYV
jgi:hypothetical protein